MSPTWERAVRSGDLEALKRLAAGGGDLDARDRHGQTALMVAATRGHAAVVDWLVACGADVNHTAKYGLSALMLGAINGRADVVRVLVEAGADRALRGTGAPGFAGRTALELARDAVTARILREADQRDG